MDEPLAENVRAIIRRSDRYALLINQLGAELGGDTDVDMRTRGWQSSVADTLGVHRSYVSRITKGDRSGIGADVISRAIDRLNLRSDFFYAHFDHEPNYRDFVVKDGGGGKATGGSTRELAKKMLHALANGDDRRFRENAVLLASEVLSHE